MVTGCWSGFLRGGEAGLVSAAEERGDAWCHARSEWGRRHALQTLLVGGVVQRSTRFASRFA